MKGKTREDKVMTTTLSFKIRIIKNQIASCKREIARGVKSYVLTLVDLETELEKLEQGKVKKMAIKLDYSKATTKLFFTEYHLAKFQEAWSNSSAHSSENWTNWLSKIWCTGGSLGKIHWKQEEAIDKDILLMTDVAKNGCQVLLRDAYHQLLDKEMYQKNSSLHDYLANAYDCVSSAQWLLARQFNIHIDWFFPEDEDFKEYEPARKPGELWEASPGSWYIAA